ncbi:MAG: hypothetical protein Kow0080_09750 [Candidatus Promineifilaceae bacterium]
MGRYTGLILIMLVIAFLLRVDFIFYVLYIVVGLFLWSRWVTPRSLKRLHTERLFNRYAFWGEFIPITIRVTNTSRLPIPWLELTESTALELATNRPKSEVIALKGRGEADVVYTVHGRRRGYYKIGPLRLATSDLFGLAEETVGFVPADYLTVYPRIWPLHQLGLPSRLPFGTIASHQRLFEDPARPTGVRNYESGDSLRRINWKVSAHTRTLKVRTFQPAISLETAVLLNLNSREYTQKTLRNNVEWAVEAAASLASHLINQRQAVGLLTNGLDPLAASSAAFNEESGRLEIAANTDRALSPPAIPPHTGRPHLIKILERLARITFQESTPLAQWAVSAALPLSWGVTLLVITPKGDEATCRTLHQLLRQGFNPVLIAIEPDGRFDQVRERARQLGFAAYNITQPHDMSIWQQPVRGTA